MAMIAARKYRPAGIRTRLTDADGHHNPAESLNYGLNGSGKDLIRR